VTSLSVVNGLVFDGVSPELTEAAVHVVDGRIVEVGEAQPADAVIDARGRTVLPGLVDAHCHAYGIDLDMLALESRPLSYVALRAAQRLGRALRRGFTTVRDPAGGDAGLARAIAEELLAAPRYLFTGPGLSQTGGHGDMRAADSDVCGCHTHATEVVDGVDALRRAVRERLRGGAHAIKIMASGGVVSPTDPIRVPQYSPEEIQVVVAEATRRGSYVAAHAYSPEAIRHAVGNGVRSVEHGNLLDAPTAAFMAQHGAYLVPTLAAYDAMERRGAELGMPQVSRDKNREVLDAGRAAVELARAAGVPVGFGTDLMGVLEDEQLHGLRLQVEVDGAFLALCSATSVNARLLGRDDLGRVAPGAVGDLLILEGNVLEAPSSLWDESCERVVVQAGRVVAG
jgi:imidazolonepropionase-like amidohydrolase